MLLYIKMVVVVLVSVSFNCTSFAQSKTDSDSLPSGKSELEFNVEIPIWIPGFRGRFSIGDITIEGEGQNENLLSQFFNSDLGVDYYFVGKVGVTKNKWQVQIDAFGGQLKDAIEFTYSQNQLVDVEVFTVMPRILVSYQILEKDFKRKQALLTKHIEFWIYGGCRYFYLNIKSELNAAIPALNIIEDWFDPIIGFTVPLTIRRLTLVFQNDIGGFGLGSDLTYWYQLYGTFQVGKYISIGAGWAHLNINYSEERRNDSFSYKVVLRGPMVGVMFTF